MKIDPLDFEGSLNMDLYIEWIQALKRYFEVRSNLMRKLSRCLFLNSRNILLFGMQTSKDNELKKRGLRSKPSPNLRDSCTTGSY